MDQDYLDKFVYVSRQRLFEGLPKDIEKEPVLKAFDFAVSKHGKQKYGVKEQVLPYIYHLVGVATGLSSKFKTVNNIQLALLHDTVEDTDTTLKELSEKFDASMALWVNDLSQGENESYRDYISKVSYCSSSVIAVKVSDICFNMQHLYYLPDKRADRLKRQYVEALTTLATEGWP